SFGANSGGSSGRQYRMKARLGALFGARTSAAVHLAYSTIGRDVGANQNERLRAYDFAMPIEFLQGVATRDTTTSLYLGPRAMRSAADDRLSAHPSLHTTLIGAVAGAHARYKFIHLFAEASVVHEPRHTYAGQRQGGLQILPAVGFMFRIGEDHQWR